MDRGEKIRPGLYKTPTGEFLVRVILKTEKGKIDRVRTLPPGTTEQAAIVQLDRLRAEVDAEVALSRSKAKAETLTAYAQRWVAEDLRKRRDEGPETDRIKHRTVDGHIRNLNVFILPLLGTCKPHELTRKAIKDWTHDISRLRTMETRRGRGKKTYQQESRPYAKATLRSAWRTLHLFLGWVTIELNLPFNPGSDLRVKMNAAAARDRTWFTFDGLVAFEKAAAADEDPMSLPATLLTIDGALRPCELAGLNVGDFDAERGTVFIQRSFTAGRLGPTKTKGSRRLVCLRNATVETLKAFTAGRGLDEPMFQGSNGKRITSTFWNAVKRIAKAAGVVPVNELGQPMPVEDACPYTLRRTANDLVRARAGDTVAQAITGHVSTQMTAHYSAFQREERVRAIDGAFGPGPLPVGPVPPATEEVIN